MAEPSTGDKAATAVPTEAAAAPAPAATAPLASESATEPDRHTTRINIELSGGLELLFGHVKRFEVALEVPGEELRVGRLLTWMRNNLLKERPELFLAEGDTLRPGILCLVNDADWELEGTVDCTLASGDTVTFISTLHGG